MFYRSSGFSFLELMLVVVLIGILAAYAAPHWNPAESTVVVQADRMMRDIRHLQMLNITQGRVLTLDIEPTGYSVREAGSVITDPATGEPFSITLENGVALSGADTDFDKLGRPANGGALLAAPRAFTLTGGTRTVAVTLQPVTGFTSVAP